MKPASWVLLIGAISSVAVAPLPAQSDQRNKPPGSHVERLAQRGNSDAQFEMGVRFLGGEGVTKDEKKAVEWLQKAADQNHLAAMNALGTLYESGVGVVKDEKQAFFWYEKAAGYGLALAQQNLAECYDFGKGVEKNPKEAAKWIALAARQDFAPSQALYAWKLERGDGVDKDTREAATWYLRAAQNGLVRAMTHLAYLYYTGKGVPLDYRRAEAWYRRAARSDDPMARNDLAWFLSVCPDSTFHDGSAAVEFARSSLAGLKTEDYQVVDTLAAALARSGDYGEAVQLQIKAIVMFDKDQAEVEKLKPEDKKRLETELSDRLKQYKNAEAFIEKNPEPEHGTKPLIEDRILQEEQIPRRKKPQKQDDRDDGSVIS